MSSLTHTHFEICPIWLQYFLKLFKKYICFTDVIRSPNKSQSGTDEWEEFMPPPNDLHSPSRWERHKAPLCFIPSSPSSHLCKLPCANRLDLSLASCGWPLPSPGQALLRRNKPFPVRRGERYAPTVTYCNTFQVVGGFYLVGERAVLGRHLINLQWNTFAFIRYV